MFLQPLRAGCCRLVRANAARSQCVKVAGETPAMRTKPCTTVTHRARWAGPRARASGVAETPLPGTRSVATEPSGSGDACVRESASRAASCLSPHRQNPRLRGGVARRAAVGTRAAAGAGSRLTGSQVPAQWYVPEGPPAAPQQRDRPDEVVPLEYGSALKTLSHVKLPGADVAPHRVQIDTADAIGGGMLEETAQQLPGNALPSPRLQSSFGGGGRACDHVAAPAVQRKDGARSRKAVVGQATWSSTPTSPPLFSASQRLPTSSTPSVRM